MIVLIDMIFMLLLGQYIAARIFAKLKQEQYLQSSEDNFIPRLAYYFAELNYIHPFRESDSRTTREFIRLLLLHNGCTVDWSAVSIEVLLNCNGSICV